MPVALGGGGTGGIGGGGKWTMSPTQAAQAMGINPTVNPYTGIAPTSPNGSGAGGYFGQPGTAASAAAGYGYAPQQGFQTSAMQDTDLVANAQNSAKVLPGTPRTPTNTNVADDGSVPGTNTAGINGTTSGSDLSQFHMGGSSTAYSANDVTKMLNDPLRFEREWLNQRGMDNPNAVDNLGAYYQFIPALASFFMSQANGKVGDGDKMLGVYDQLLSNYTTPGGRTIDPSEMLRQIMANGTIENGSAVGANQLQQMYGRGETGAKNISDLWQAATGFLPGAYGQAMQDAITGALSDWRQASMDSRNAAVGTSNPYNTSFADYLETDPLFKRFAGV